MDRHPPGLHADENSYAGSCQQTTWRVLRGVRNRGVELYYMIQLFRPFMDDQEVEAVTQVIRSAWIGMGPKTAEFEKAFAAFLGMPYAVGVSSATAALHMAVQLLNIKRGCEVIVPAMTFVSTAHAVAYELATPIFADVDPNTLLLDLDDAARRITRRTCAIIPVHYGGRPVDMDRLRQVAGDIPLIEDAAHACGARYKGRNAGALGDLACFSFQAIKNLAMSDGGAVVMRDEAMLERARRLRWLGIAGESRDGTGDHHAYWWQYSAEEIGTRSAMNDIAAAMGLVQLRKLGDSNARRRQIAEKYTAGLQDLPWLQTPPMDTPDSQSSWHIYSIQAEARDDLGIHLRQKGIETGVHYRPIHQHPCYGNQPCLPVAERLATRILSLPMHPGLTEKDVAYVIDTIRSFSPPSQRSVAGNQALRVVGSRSTRIEPRVETGEGHA